MYWTSFRCPSTGDRVYLEADTIDQLRTKVYGRMLPAPSTYYIYYTEDEHHDQETGSIL